MPEVSRFYGIVIRMFFREHGPPHFHAEYGGQQAVVGIEDLTVLRGRLPLGFLPLPLGVYPAGRPRFLANPRPRDDARSQTQSAGALGCRIARRDL